MRVIIDRGVVHDDGLNSRSFPSRRIRLPDGLEGNVKSVYQPMIFEAHIYDTLNVGLVLVLVNDVHEIARNRVRLCRVKLERLSRETR